MSLVRDRISVFVLAAIVLAAFIAAAFALGWLVGKMIL
jgi:hypothetical protein